MARQVLTNHLVLLAQLDEQIAEAESAMAALLPTSPFTTLTSVPGWGTVRVGNYAAAVGNPYRWPAPLARTATALPSLWSVPEAV